MSDSTDQNVNFRETKDFSPGGKREHINDAMLSAAGTDTASLIIKNIGDLPAFHPIRYGETRLDHKKLTEELCEAVKDALYSNPDVGAILLECSDLPPYARAIQSVSGLPVFDFNTMIDLVYHAVVQKTYYGYF